MVTLWSVVARLSVGVAMSIHLRQAMGLRYLLQGLEVPDVEWWMDQHTESLKALGKAVSGQAKRCADMQAALAELVALESMKDELSLMLLREEGGMGAEYDRRKPLAWARARDLVGERK